MSEFVGRMCELEELDAIAAQKGAWFIEEALPHG